MLHCDRVVGSACTAVLHEWSAAWLELLNSLGQLWFPKANMPRIALVFSYCGAYLHKKVKLYNNSSKLVLFSLFLHTTFRVIL